jgi:maleate isomerase
MVRHNTLSARNFRIGVITPSTNTTLEPILCSMLQGTEITTHYSRFRVKNLSLKKKDIEQFSLNKMLIPAGLLSDAQVDIIAWFGTSGGWIGPEKDLQLCETIERKYAKPAVTATISSMKAMETLNISKFSLVVPYERDVTHRIVKNFKQFGFSAVNVKFLNLTDNIVVGKVSSNSIAKMVEECAKDSEGVLVYCTNFSVALIVDKLEKMTRVPILDSVNVTLWGCLQKLGIKRGLKGYGRLLDINPKWYDKPMHN